MLKIKIKVKNEPQVLDYTGIFKSVKIPEKLKVSIIKIDRVAQVHEVFSTYHFETEVSSDGRYVFMYMEMEVSIPEKVIRILDDLKFEGIIVSYEVTEGENVHDSDSH